MEGFKGFSPAGEFVFAAFLFSHDHVTDLVGHAPPPIKVFNRAKRKNSGEKKVGGGKWWRTL
jgi:hypothetical protein